MRSRYLVELTTPEVENYLKQGGKTALLPAGSVEMHGPHAPIGTDTIAVKGFCALLAEATNGIIFPEVSYSWAGATDGFAGTVSIPPDRVIDLVTLVFRRAWTMGFRRLVVVSIHGTNDDPLTICVRRIYETDGIVAQYLNPYKCAPPEAEALFADEWAEGKETSMLLASLDILGCAGLYPEKELAYDDPAPPMDIHSMDFRGATGFFYQDLRHHLAPTRFVSTERGRRYYDILVKAVAPTIANLDKYHEVARNQKNQGWFRDSRA